MTRWIVTGAAGFIGSHVVLRLLHRGDEVVGIDNLDPYYDPALKNARLQRLQLPGFRFLPADVADANTVSAIFSDVRPERVIHLAAQPGVRQALITPLPYARTNLMGFVFVLEASQQQGVEHFVYASSSSVYGETSKLPFSERNHADHPVSLYAATKRANELMAHSYSHIYGIPTTGLRYFTVYGPWGRPDMAYFLFARDIMERRPLHVFGDGSALRDFTYVDDIVEGTLRVADQVPSPDPLWKPSHADPASSSAPYRVYNIGRGEQVTLTHMIDLLEEALGQTAQRLYEGQALGDLPETHADVSGLAHDVGFTATVSLKQGLATFANWFIEYGGYRAQGRETLPNPAR